MKETKYMLNKIYKQTNSQSFMKKYLVIAAAAAVVLGACAKVETVQNTRDENVVTFGVYAGNTAVTRATYGDITTANLQTSTDGFGVFAYYTQANDWASTDTPNFMYNQQVKYNSSANTTLYPAKWEYTPLKYWPNGQNSTTVETGTFADKLSFYAYAPHIATVNTVPAAGQGITAMSANNAGGAPTVTFTVPSKAEEQIDLLWATPVLNQTHKALNGKVAFTFSHALTKLNFQAQAVVDAVNPTTANLGAETTIILESLEIKADGTKTGTLTLDSATPATPNWSAPSGETVVTYNEDSFASKSTVGPTGNQKTGFVVTETATDLNATISPMIIPATIASGKFVITANYWVLTADAALAGGYSVVQQVIKKTSDAAVTFAAGKKYTIVVRLGLNSVDFDVTEVTAWTAETGTPVDLPINTAS